MRAIFRAIMVLLLAAVAGTVVLGGFASAQQCPPNCPITKPPALPEPPAQPSGE